MADADYRSWVEVLPTFDQFNDTVETAVVGGMGRAGTSGSTAMGGAMVAGVGRFALPLLAAITALGIGSAIADQVRAGVDAAANYIQTSVSLASSLNESINAVTVAYGEQADAVLRLGEDAPRTYALTSLAVNQFAVRFSGFATRIAGDGGDVAGTLESLIARGTDFASVYDIDVAEALDKFQSGLAGEVEPLRQYSIDLSMATLQSYAYANGIAEQGRQLTDTQRVQAAYLALMDQTSGTQGDFARTSDSLANSMRSMQAEIDTVAAEFGAELLPVVTELAAFARAELLPMWAEFNAEMGPRLREALEEALPYLLELVERLLPLIPPLIDLIVDALIWFVENLDTTIRFVDLIVGTLQDFFDLLSGDTSVDQFVANFQERLRAWVAGALGSIAEVSVGFYRFGLDIIASIARIGDNLYQSGRAMIQRFIDGIWSMVNAAGNAISGVLNFVLGFLPHSPAERGPLSGAGWDSIAQAGAAITRQLESGFGTPTFPIPDLRRSITTSAMLNGSEASLGLLASQGEMLVALRPQDIDRLAEAVLRRARRDDRMEVA